MGQSAAICCRDTKEAPDFLLSNPSTPITNNNEDYCKTNVVSFDYFISKDFVVFIKDKSLDSIPQILLKIIKRIHTVHILEMIRNSYDFIILYQVNGSKREMKIKKQFAYATRAVLIDVKELITLVDLGDYYVVKELQACLVLSIEMMLLIQEVLKETMWDDVIRIIYELTERLIIIRKMLRKVNMIYYNANEKVNYESNLILAKNFYGDIVINALNAKNK